MNFRKSLTIVSFFALAPLAAFADSPSGEYWDQIASTAPATEVADSRGENRNYVEFTFDQMVADSTKSHDKTREEVRAEIAAMPLPHVEA